MLRLRDGEISAEGIEDSIKAVDGDVDARLDSKVLLGTGMVPT
jgi:hypothetical protein